MSGENSGIMTYALIGTGNMAWLIASRMLSAGHTCVGVWGRSTAGAEALCRAFHMPRLASLNQVNDGPDAVIIAVSDAAIADVAKSLSLQHSALIHTSGSVPLRILDGCSLNIGVVWPVYSIRKDSLPAHRAFPVVVEGNNDTARKIIHGIATAICDITYEADSGQRAWLHLAAVIGNNFVNHLLGIAASISAAQHTPISILQPLLEQTISDMRARHPFETQTGPAKRGDTATMQRHLEMLHAHPEWQKLYEALSASIAAANTPGFVP
jgi:predicted short-subunit dehydrogenase-like oxidoreductase (DUF2520 family)